MLAQSRVDSVTVMEDGTERNLATIDSQERKLKVLA